MKLRAEVDPQQSWLLRKFKCSSPELRYMVRCHEEFLLTSWSTVYLIAGQIRIWPHGHPTIRQSLGSYSFKYGKYGKWRQNWPGLLSCVLSNLSASFPMLVVFCLFFLEGCTCSNYVCMSCQCILIVTLLLCRGKLAHS